VASDGHDPHENLVASGGAPSGETDIVAQEAGIQDDQFEDSTGKEGEVGDADRLTLLYDKNSLLPIVHGEDKLSQQESKITVMLRAPSTSGENETVMLRKPDVSYTAEVDSTRLPTLDRANIKAADYIQIPVGGICTTHGCMGVKRVKKWCMRKDGTYGNKYLRKTEYKCQDEGIAVSNSSSQNLGSVEQTRSSQRVGNNSISQGTKHGISGVVMTGSGDNESESFEKGLKRRNPD